jgi:hypothetical protein
MMSCCGQKRAALKPAAATGGPPVGSRGPWSSVRPSAALLARNAGRPAPGQKKPSGAVSRGSMSAITRASDENS